MLNKKISVPIIILVVILIPIVYILSLSSSDKYIDEKNRELLSKYGWNDILSGILLSKEPKGITMDLKNNELDKMQIAASQKIGLDPTPYINKPISIYYYKLAKYAGKEPLVSIMWVYKGKTVCAYITHTENNLKIKYWPLNTPYNEIVDDIHKLYDDFNKNKSSLN